MSAVDFSSIFEHKNDISKNKENFPYFFLDLYIIKYIMNLVLDSKLVLLQTHYWLVHSPPLLLH